MLPLASWTVRQGQPEVLGEELVDAADAWRGRSRALRSAGARTRPCPPHRTTGRRCGCRGTRRCGVFLVQSLPSETSSIGRGAAAAAISTLLVSWVLLLWTGMPLSQTQPPKKWAETMTTGIETAMRSSTAASMKDCVPPPEAPVMAIRLGSTSVRDVRKSTARMLFQSWSLKTLGLRVLPAGVGPVAVADHVIRKDNRAHAGERGAAFLHVRPEPAVIVGIAPVAVRTENRRERPGPLRRPVQVPRDEHARQALKGHVLDGVAVVLAFAVNDRVQGALLRQRRQAPRPGEFPPESAAPAAATGRVRVRLRKACELLLRLLLGLVVPHAELGFSSACSGPAWPPAQTRTTIRPSRIRQDLPSTSHTAPLSQCHNTLPIRQRLDLSRLDNFAVSPHRRDGGAPSRTVATRLRQLHQEPPDAGRSSSAAAAARPIRP